MTAGTLLARALGRGCHRSLPALCLALVLAGMLAAPIPAAARLLAGPTAGAAAAAAGAPPSQAPESGPWVVPPWPDVPAGATPTIGTLEPGEVGVLTQDGIAAALVRVRDVRFHDSVPGLEPRWTGDRLLELTVDIHVLRAADPTVPYIAWDFGSGASGLAPGTDWPMPAFPGGQALTATQDMSGKIGLEVTASGGLTMAWMGPDGVGFTYLIRAEDFRLPSGFTSTGWPVAAAAFGDAVTFGADGTVYMTYTATYDEWFHQQELLALDAHGHVRSGWSIPASLSWRVWPDIVPAPDGTVYVSAGTEIDAFGSDGARLHGWPVTVPGVWLAPPPVDGTYNPLAVLPLESGGVDVIFGGPDGVDVLLSLDRDGAVRPGWPVVIPALWIRDSAPPFVAAHDVLVLTSIRSGGHGDVVEITAYGLDGKVLPGWPTRRWDDIAMAPDGRLVAWRNTEAWVGTTATDSVTYAVLGADGRPAEGWPRTLHGQGSRPAFARDGAVEVVTVDRWPSGRARLVALDRSGRVRAGYPVDLPAGMGLDGVYGPTRQPATAPQPLLIADDGTTYVSGYVGTRATIAAFSRAGRPLDGWPYRLPAGRTFATSSAWTSDAPAMPMQVGPQRRLVVATASSVPKDVLGRGQILVIDAHGRTVRGWPRALPELGTPLGFQVTPTGDVTAAGLSWLTLRLWVTRLDPGGRIAR